MYRTAQPWILLLATLLSVAGCSASPAKKADIWDLYDMHNNAAAKAGTLPRDNDSYYRPPGAYSCNTIADLPSCGSD